MEAADELRIFCVDLIAFNDEFGLTERLENWLNKKETPADGGAADTP